MDKLVVDIPIVSIILPVYNGEKFLVQSIESCLAQTHENLELIIVNDASTDLSLKIANDYLKSDKRVRVISNPINLNLPASLNIGHEVARGAFLTWTSDDNYYSPNAIEIFLKEMKEQQADIVFSNFSIINEKGEIKGNYMFKNENTILLENIVGASFLYRKEVFLKNNGYNESLFKIEDYDFWLNASKYALIRHIKQTLYYYRSHNSSLTHSRNISQFIYEDDFVKKVKEMYKLFFNSFAMENSEEMAEKFHALHLNKKIDVYNFIKDFSSFKEKLILIFEIYGKKRVLKEIDQKIRYNIQRFPSNQKFETLLIIITHRPSILLKYSKRRTLKILNLFLKKRKKN